MIECLKMHKENFDYCLGELIRESEEKDKEIERLNYKIEELKDLLTTERYCKDDYKNTLNELKLCNSDYYNQICTLSSKLALINLYINEDKNCVPKHISDYVNKVLFDKTIKLGSDKE